MFDKMMSRGLDCRNVELYLHLYLLVTLSFCLHFGTSMKIGVVYQSGVDDQIHKSIVNRAALWNPSLPDTDLQLLWRPLNISSTMFALEEVCELVEHGIQGLVTVLPCRVRQFIISQADVFHLPHVAVHADRCESILPKQYSIHLNADFIHRNDIIQDILNEMHWRSVTLVFDDSFDIIQRKSLLFSLSANMVEASIVMINPSRLRDQETNILIQLTSLQTDAIIVMVTRTLLDTFLTQAKGMDLMKSKFYWILMLDDIEPSEAMYMLQNYNSSNILLVRKAWSGSQKCKDGHCGMTSCMEDVTCTYVCPYMNQLEATLADAVSLLLEAGDGLPGDVTTQPTISCRARDNYTVPHGSNIMERIKTTHSDGFTESGGFTEDGFPRRVNYELFSVHNMAEKPLTLVGSWDSEDGLTFTETQKLFLNKFYDFGWRELTIATLEVMPSESKVTGIETLNVTNVEQTENNTSHPFSVPDNKQTSNETSFSGFAFDILNELAARLKFKYRVVEPPDRLYGAPNPDGSWNGMVGMVKRGEVDMAVGPFTITSIRESVIDFTKPYLEDSSGILTRKPQEEDSQIFQMFKPYSGEVWGAIAATTFFVGVISYLVNYNTPYSGIRQGLDDATTDEIDFKENLWLIYSSVMEQGATYHPNATSGRLVLGFFWLFTIVVVAIYTANLAAFLTVAVPFIPINSLGELLKQTEIQPVVKDGTNLWAMFQSSKRGIYMEVWDRLQKSPRATVTEDAVKLVETGQYAYISDKALLEYIAIRGCEFAVANEVFNTAGYGFVMPENAPFEDAVNYNIMKMQEAGLIEKWRQKWWSPDGAKCSSADRTGSAVSLNLGNLGGAFLVYIIVAGVAIVCLGLEIIGKSSGIMTKLRLKFQKPLKAKTNGFHQNGTA